MATTLIGMLPTYDSIGVLAPVLLTALRFVQGLAIGGQWGGAMLLVTEHAPPHRRGLYGSFVQIGVPAGTVLSNGIFMWIVALATNAQFIGWAWRLPFMVSVVLIGIAVYVQVTVHDAPVFEAVKRNGTQPRIPVGEALRLYPREIVLAAGALVAAVATYYVVVTWATQYATTELGLSKGAILAPEMVGAAVQIGTVLLGGWLADRVGRRPAYLAGAALLGFWAFPFFWLLNTGTTLGVWTAVVVSHAGLGLIYGPQAAVFSELFGTRVRYSGVSLAYQLGAILGGAFAPIIAAALFAWASDSIAVSGYLLLVAIVSFASVVALRETKDEAIDGTGAMTTVTNRTSSATGC